jgi:hypothetical protein
MSLKIDVAKVTAIMLNGQWHPVADNDEGHSTFHIDAYEFVWYDNPEDANDFQLMSGGTAGFQFIDRDGLKISGRTR